MASKEASSHPACTVCHDTSLIMKVISPCEHVVCRKCLTKHIESLPETDKTFQCRTCGTDCPLPDDGIEGFKDYRREDVEVVASSGSRRFCSGCRYAKKLTVEGESRCQECGGMYLCGDCTLVHRSNKATSHHVVIALKSLKDEYGDSCRKHGDAASSYCCTCMEPCCHLCILLDHGNHDIKKIWEVFHSLGEELTEIVQDHENKSKMLKMSEGQFQMLSDCEVSARRDKLLGEIEEYAERCMDSVQKQKDAMKGQVQNDYRTVADVSDWLNKVTVLPELHRILADAKVLLAETGPYANDIQRLAAAKERIQELHIPSKFDIDGYWQSYTNLMAEPRQFEPNNKNYNIGNITSTQRGDEDIFKSCERIFEKEFVVDDKTKFIPHVTVLGGGYYAVAHPANEGKSSEAIHIYKTPGKFQQTITDHIDPLYGMAATPSGCLAVLSAGEAEGSGCVHLFNPKRGYLRSTNEFSLQQPRSFDVNMRNQFVILSGDAQQIITNVEEDGSVSRTQPIDDNKQYAKIACHAGSVLLRDMKDDKRIDAIDLRDGRSTFCTRTTSINDLALTVFGEGVYVYQSCNEKKFRSFQLHSLDDELTFETQRKLFTMTAGQGTEARVSVGHNHIVTSLGNMLYVYQYE